MCDNFGFLKNANDVLYVLGKSIEKQVYTAPSAVLCEGTAFLDNLLIDIYDKMDMDYNDHEKFSEKIMFLHAKGTIDDELKSDLLSAATRRNSMHGRIPDAENYLNGNKLRALQMHKHLFNASFRYYQLFYNEKAKKPSYIHPKNLLEEDLSIETCIVCGSKTSSDSMFCSNCNWEKRQYHNLKTLINDKGYDGSFRKEDLIRLGFDKGTANQLLRELQNQNLIRALNKVYRFNKDEIVVFQDKIDKYFRIEELIHHYSKNKLSLKEIKATEEFIEGKNNVEPFIEFYKIINEDSISQFMEQYEHRDIRTILESGILTEEEFQFYLNNSDDFANIKEDVKDRFLELKKLRKSKEDIKSQLCINDDMYEEFANIKEIQNSLEENKKQQYLNSIAVGRTYEDALKINNLTQEELNGYINEDSAFKEKYVAVLEKRKEHFLNLAKDFSIEKAFKQSKLTEEQLRNAFVRKTHDDFYIRLNQILRENYLQCRREGKTPAEAEEYCCIDSSTVDNWLTIKEFKREFYDLKYDIMLNELKAGKSHDEALKIANISKKEFINNLLRAYDADENNELLVFYKENILPDEFDRFLKELSKKDEKKALKQVLLDKKLLNLAINNNEEYEEKYLDVKMLKFIEYSAKYRTAKALKKSGLSKVEYDERKDFLSAKKIEHQQKIIINEINYGKTLKQAAKKVNLTLDDIYKKYEEGKEGDEVWNDFADQLDVEYIKPALEIIDGDMPNPIELFKVMEKHHHDFDYWIKLNLLNQHLYLDLDL